ncbi:unnamed protein product [Moneuplotes crassus]|uniref:Sm domain-containing protein n=2 Tax=Euplotes crassus TaxID=5936 RepID=A0AAD1Y0Z0_EUPCR|nr:unnamed protein product [Moneuplotes crassus]
MVFATFFQVLSENNARITIHLKNDLAIEGNIQSVDEYLNIVLSEIDVVNNEENPYLLSVKKLLIRGNTISHISMPDHGIDTDTIQELAMKDMERK